MSLPPRREIARNQELNDESEAVHHFFDYKYFSNLVNVIQNGSGRHLRY